jgi:hypothetical protein
MVTERRLKRKSKAAGATAGFVSRARCSVLHAAPQNRDRYECCLRYDPGSAAHRFALRCVRGTLVRTSFARLSSATISLNSRFDRGLTHSIGEHCDGSKVEVEGDTASSIVLAAWFVLSRDGNRAGRRELADQGVGNIGAGTAQECS